MYSSRGALLQVRAAESCTASSRPDRGSWSYIWSRLVPRWMLVAVPGMQSSPSPCCLCAGMDRGEQPHVPQAIPAVHQQLTWREGSSPVSLQANFCALTATEIENGSGPVLRCFRLLEKPGSAATLGHRPHGHRTCSPQALPPPFPPQVSRPERPRPVANPGEPSLAKQNECTPSTPHQRRASAA